MADFWNGAMTALVIAIVAAMIYKRLAVWLSGKRQSQARYPSPPIRGYIKYDVETHGACLLCGGDVPSKARWC